MDDNQSRVDRLFTHHYVNRYEGSHVPCYDVHEILYSWPPKSKNSSLQFWNSKLEFVSSFRVLMTDQKSFHLKSFKARGRILQILWSAGAKLYTHSFLECAHLLLTHKNSLLFMIIIYYEGLWISCCSITAFSFALSWTINCQSWLGVIHSLYTKYFG